MKILAIETSCDETAAAIIEATDEGKLNILTNIVASQLKTHAKTGGVIPDVAARMHTEALTHVLDQATEGKKLDFDAIAVTSGPGLIGCLLIGQSAAKTIAQVTGKPFYPINHLEGHLYSAWLGENQPELPSLIAIISGGHSELVLMESHLQYKHIGATRDDAAGEAFDKVARLLGLPYPGGPAIDHLAREGNADAYKLPISLPEHGNLEFSFSGLKAAVAGLVGKLPDPIPRHIKADVAASFQKTVADTIAKKTVWALEKNPEVKSVCLVGGVAANEHLRVRLEQAVHMFNSEIKFFVPEFKYCTDNAAMIGAAAVFHMLYGKPTPWQDLVADPNLTLGP
ncbi:MAG: Glycoprotease/Kae1 family metallohydrolase [Berkelbacteria bacterium GW2011_GWA2_46_7]|uniref:tRNA N6-adenosine threonylcarbamoyltransferase n=1 Tax=Berkelbacteria bacterium GW2011_GWA2_46_7 TaxID=1618335 RepID=A0A0G1SQW1_9BACT|nr:MAG: Glycoprotease/Kae1 family metallohydrolase [Berkelbacteria bacterium GW2011_GWA2_46_7]